MNALHGIISIVILVIVIVLYMVFAVVIIIVIILLLYMVSNIIDYIGTGAPPIVHISASYCIFNLYYYIEAELKIICSYVSRYYGPY